MSDEEFKEEKDPMVIHDAIEKCVYTPKMDGGHNPEDVCRKISASIQKIHSEGLKKEIFFPTFLVSEMAQDAEHSWAKEEGQFGFIYGYVFGYMLANFEKNKDTKLVWDKRPMTAEEIAESKDVTSSAEASEEVLETLKDLGIDIDAIQEEGFGFNEHSDPPYFDPPEPWSPDNMEGYDPTK